MADPINKARGFFSADHSQGTRPMTRIFSEFGKNYSLFLFPALLTSIITALLRLMPPYIIGLTIDSVLNQNKEFQLFLVPESLIPESPIGLLLFAFGLLLSIYGLGALLNAASGLLWNLFTLRVQHDVRDFAYKSLQKLPVYFFEVNRTGQILSVLNNDVNQLEDFLNRWLGDALRVVLVSLGAAILMFSINWSLALVALLPAPVVVFLALRYNNSIEPKQANVRQSVGELNSTLEGNISGIDVIKSFNKEEQEIERVREGSLSYVGSKWDVVKANNRYFPSIQFFQEVGYALVFFVGSYIVLGGSSPFSTTLAVGSLVTFLFYSRMFVSQIFNVGNLLDTYQDVKASSARIFALIDLSDSFSGEKSTNSSPTPGNSDRHNINGKIEYSNVWFSYPGELENILREITCSFEAGETVGIVGPTGSGKTTMVKLLLSFYEPDRGDILIDNQSIQDYSPKEVRSSVGYVSQEPFLFNESVENNITYGADNPNSVDKEEVIEAAKTAGAHRFIKELPNQYETVVGERGVKLSGGQRQRISLARAIIRDPQIFILDEATSHIDNKTEFLIQNRLKDVSTDKTTITIAHRLSTVNHADAIIVMDDGEIVERGNHEQLLSENGLYRELWNVQLG